MTPEEKPVSKAPPRERLAYYRRMLDEAVRNAEAAQNPALARFYLDIAAGWRTLAVDTEHYLFMSEDRNG